MRKTRFIAVIAAAACALVVIFLSLRDAASVVPVDQNLKSLCLRAYNRDSIAESTLRGLGTNAIPGLIVLLQSQDSPFRKQLWSVLPRLPAKFRRTIADHYPPPSMEFVREVAAHGLGLLGPEGRPTIPALARALRDGEGRVGWEAASALGLIGKDSLPVLIEALDDKDAKVRHGAAYALGWIGADSQPAIPGLVRRLGDPTDRVRNAAAYSLTCCGTTGTLALVDASREQRGTARETAMNMLTNSYVSLQRAASELYAMTHEAAPDRRRRAIEALGKIRAAGDLAPQAAIELLQDPMLEVRLAAIKILEARPILDTAMLQPLIESLRDELPSVRDASARALGTIGAQAESGVPALLRLEKDPHQPVRVAAQLALEKITSAKQAQQPGSASPDK